MHIFVPNQMLGEERRVALVPAVVKKLVEAGHRVTVEPGAGAGAMLADALYEAAGAVSAINPADAWAEADLVAVVSPPPVEDAARMKRGAVLLGTLRPFDSADLIRTLADRGVSAIALELLPRITRAQPMDVLSSQANLAGYKAVLLAAEACPRIFPMMMTAAGTLQPAKVFVIGVGVAGLQAIATAKRLGAVVSAYDVRPAVKEQVLSVGAKFVELPLDTSAAADSGGYAKAQSDEQQRKQAELMANTVAASDVVISTASIPGKPAPKLITAAAVERMSAGSVIVDLAAERGGNCELTEPGRVVVKHGVTIVGHTNFPSLVPQHASQMFAANVQKMLGVILDKAGALKLDLSDELIAGTLLTHDGAIVHPLLKPKPETPAT
jgi:NAD(P) transhydrogenase subunit alpha